MSTKTSLGVFRSFLAKNEDGSIDARGVLSRECYLAWLVAQKKTEDSPQDYKKYHRALTNHVSGVDGRHPFEEDEERAILIELRKKGPWPCFPDSSSSGSYRGRGYHEKLAAGSNSSSTNNNGSPLLNMDSLFPPPTSANAKRGRTSPAAELQVCEGRAAAAASELREHASLLADSDDFPRIFAEKMLAYANSFTKFGCDEWESLSAILRFVVLARTKAIESVRTREYAHSLATRFPASDAVFVVDLTCKECAHRTLAQNALSQELFGDLTPMCKYHMLQYQDLRSLLMAVLNCIHRPGQTFGAPLHSLRLTTGEIKPFETSFILDATSHLLIMISKPLFSHQPAAAAAAATEYLY